MKTPTTDVIHNKNKFAGKRKRYSIHLRIILDRSIKYIPIPAPLKVSDEQWSGKDGRWINDKHPYAFEINDRIRETRNKVEEVVKRFYIHGKQVAMNDILQHMLKKGDSMIFNDFVREYIRLKPEKLSIPTWEKYITFANHLDEFNPKIHFINVTPQLASDFKKYLEEIKGFTGSTMKVYFDKFKKVIRYAEKENYVDEAQTKYLFDDAVIRVNKAKRIYLEIEEIKLQEPESQSSQYRKSRYRVNRTKVTIVNRLKVITLS